MIEFDLISLSGEFQCHDFAGRFTAPRFATSKTSDLVLVVDAASVELFAYSGSTIMTAIYFPDTSLDKLNLKHTQPIQQLLIPLKSIC